MGKAYWARASRLCSASPQLLGSSLHEFEPRNTETFIGLDYGCPDHIPLQAHPRCLKKVSPGEISHHCHQRSGRYRRLSSQYALPPVVPTGTQSRNEMTTRTRLSFQVGCHRCVYLHPLCSVLDPAHEVMLRLERTNKMRSRNSAVRLRGVLSLDPLSLSRQTACGPALLRLKALQGSRSFCNFWRRFGNCGEGPVVFIPTLPVIRSCP